MPMRLPPTMSVSTVSPTNIASDGSTPIERRAWWKISGCGLHERATLRADLDVGRSGKSGQFEQRLEHW